MNPSIIQQIAEQTAFETVKAEMGLGGKGGICVPFYRMDTLSSAQM